VSELELWAPPLIRRIDNTGSGYDQKEEPSVS
jgi:hypothetical protein